MTEEKNIKEKDERPSTVIIQAPVNETNGVGIAGFVLSIVAIFLGCVPVLGWILWLLGLVFSIIGVTKKPKGLAIAGLVISLLGVILLLLVFVGALSLSALSGLSQ